jgi:hypothetical protein
MIAYREMGDGSIYVCFPVDLSDSRRYCIPKDLKEWLKRVPMKDWGYLNNVRSGVFLMGEDSIAFKLTFDIKKL